MIPRLIRLGEDFAKVLKEVRARDRQRQRCTRFHLQGGSSAVCHPRSLSDFRHLLELLKLNKDWNQAAKVFDQLEWELNNRNAFLPLPSELIQHEDCSLFAKWEFLGLRVWPNGCAWIFGGPKGKPEKGKTYPRDVVNLLEFHAKMSTQRSA